MDFKNHYQDEILFVEIPFVSKTQSKLRSFRKECVVQFFFAIQIRPFQGVERSSRIDSTILCHFCKSSTPGFAEIFIQGSSLAFGHLSEITKVKILPGVTLLDLVRPVS